MDFPYGQETCLPGVGGGSGSRPAGRGLAGARSRSVVADRFGAPATTPWSGDAPVSSGRAVFETAGWVFVEPDPEVAVAAVTRDGVPGAEAVRPVLVARSGEIMIGTDLVVVRVAPDLSEQEALLRMRADGLTLVRRLRFAT